MDSIEPYDYSGLKAFSTAYLPGFLADKYDVSVKDSQKRADTRCASTLEDALRGTVTGYGSCTLEHKQIDLKRGKVHYALLPVWMLHTKWNGQDFLFAMNGQTGKMVGDLPTSKGKFWGLFAAIAAPMTVVLTINFDAVVMGEKEMKKKTNGFVSVLLALCLLLAPMTVFAESNAQLNYVTDDAGILTDSQWEDLEQRAQQVSEEYQCGVYMITVDDYTDYSTESVYTADYTIYHNYEMGMGEDRDGIMILLSMEDRDYAMFVYGPKASEVFDAYGQEQLETYFLDNFREDDWYGGFGDYHRCLQQITYSLQNREHLSVHQRAMIPVTMRIMRQLQEKISG